MSAKPAVCVMLPLEPELEARIRERCELRKPEGFGREERFAALSGVEGVLVPNGVRVDAEFMDAAPGLRVVSGFGVGYDKFDVAEATKRGIVVCHTPGVLDGAVANLVFGMLLSLSRRLVEHDAYVRAGKWGREPQAPLGFDLEGKTLGVIGFGRIGREVTRRAAAFGMRPVFHDVFEVPPRDAPESSYRRLDALLVESDVVTLHVDLNPSSHHLIGEAELDAMKPTAVLINTSRGPVVDQRALAAALRSGSIAAAGIDVFEQEPPDPDDPMLTAPNLLCAPHVGTATEETRYAMRELSVRNLLAGIARQRPPACVNPEVAG